jgi:RNA polymerase sigma-70 factor (ECF subfamily)
MLSPTDKYLVESIRNGDRKAFEFLFRNYYPDLCRYARNLVVIESVAEDLVMDVFMKIWEAEKKLEITTSLSGYIFTSVHNHCLNYLTRKHKRFTELDEATIERLNKVIPTNAVASPFDIISTLELGVMIERSIGSLPEECRKIFVMSRTEGMSNKEIASALGISENTVKVQIYRALKKLRIILHDSLPSSILV